MKASARRSAHSDRCGARRVMAVRTSQRPVRELTVCTAITVSAATPIRVSTSSCKSLHDCIVWLYLWYQRCGHCRVLRDSKLKTQVHELINPGTNDTTTENLEQAQPVYHDFISILYLKPYNPIVKFFVRSSCMCSILHSSLVSCMCSVLVCPLLYVAQRCLKQ